VPRCDARCAPSPADGWAVQPLRGSRPIPGTSRIGSKTYHALTLRQRLCSRTSLRSSTLPFRSRAARQARQRACHLCAARFTHRAISLSAFGASLRLLSLRQRVPWRSFVNLTAPAARQPDRLRSGTRASLKKQRTARLASRSAQVSVRRVVPHFIVSCSRHSLWPIDPTGTSKRKDSPLPCVGSLLARQCPVPWHRD
jgi:hypothetical protein